MEKVEKLHCKKNYCKLYVKPGVSIGDNQHKIIWKYEDYLW